MSDYPMLISNKLHSFRNFLSQRYIKNPLPYQRQRILERKIPKKGDFLVFLSRECYSPTLMAL